MNRVRFCVHHVCKCARAAELALIYDQTGDTIHLIEAIKVHRTLVRVPCRKEKAPAGETGAEGLGT